MIDDKLYTLIVLERERNYTKTAAICHISQPAVTQHIKSLEDFYGIKIFKRNGRELLLTIEGELLVKNARRLYALNNKIKSEIELSLKKLKQLNIGITLTAGGYFIPEILKVFKENYPLIKFNFHTDLAENLINRINNFELDFAIIDGIPPKNNLNKTLLSMDQLIVIANNSHPLLNEKNVSFDMLKKEDFILRHDTADTRKAFDAYLKNHLETIDDFNIILEIDNTALIKELIIKGYGISIMSKALCEQNIKQGAIKEIKINDFKLERGIYLVYPQNLKNNEIITSIINIKK
ncbi:LysR family transcriptional regulator [Haploplasma modicum]|uniref:LysR family transcriptional regulator n=1 Tax=Haploplasma modicum TaxID=2150 RepID=UPI00047A8F95|nr:LysR family transcriptional regulator [Haploplasma modicum]MCR1809480.1 LysR family transcriptional regulator [Haploplasma modicum]